MTCKSTDYENDIRPLLETKNVPCLFIIALAKTSVRGLNEPT